MSVKGKDVVGLNVVTITDGKIIETVDDIAYNPETHRVEALLVSSGGLFGSAKAIHMDDVKNIGEDAVIVADASVMKSIKDIGGSVRSISDSNKHLVKTNVLTVDGKELGKVTDIYFNSKNGIVEKMEVSQGGLKTLTDGKKSIKPSDIVTIGEDATIVSNYMEMELEEQGEQNGLKGALNDAKENFSEMKDAATEKTKEVTEAARQKSAELGEKTKEKSDEAGEFIREKANDAQDQVETAKDNMKAGINDAKEKHSDEIDTIRNKSSEVVEQTKEKIKDGTKEIERSTTKMVNEKNGAKDVADKSSKKAAVVKQRIEGEVDKAKGDTVKGEAKIKTSQVRDKLS